ncbi:MAG: hypothetical protein CM15mP47_4140 [Methanobacteriota archaeon]|nr:MAG: hypothetical protein CM15mP47_4140 [Euryarchaeota archaeon]
MAEPVLDASVILPSAICCAASLVDHKEPSSFPDSISVFFRVGIPSPSLAPEERQASTVASSIKFRSEETYRFIHFTRPERLISSKFLAFYCVWNNNGKKRRKAFTGH